MSGNQTPVQATTTRATSTVARHLSLTPASFELFIELARDARNWSGTPMLGGNVAMSKERCGNVTHLKCFGLIKTWQDGGATWVAFTPDGEAFALEHGIEVAP